MKNYTLIIVCMYLLLSTISCRETDTLTGTQEVTALRESVQSDYSRDLIIYKNSPHFYMVGYFQNLGANNTSESVLKLPDSLDIISLWGRIENAPNFSSSLNDIHFVQKNKGTRFVTARWLTDAGQQTEAGFTEWAKLMNDSINKWGLNGIDIDLEPGIVPRNSNLLKFALKELCKYFGPKSGTDKLLVFDTDGALGNTLINILNDPDIDYDYMFFQAYNRNGDRWFGKSEDLIREMNTYGSKIGNNKFMALVNGESGAGWVRNSYFGGPAAQIVEYAEWCKINGAGGVGAYGINKDYQNNKYENVRAAIRLMNPPPPAPPK